MRDKHITDIPDNYTLLDYGLIYYNSGTAITAEYLTLDNVGVSGIKSAHYYAANVTDLGYGVSVVGYVTVEDADGNVITIYTEELGAKYSDLAG